ncbi:hypothetical protein SAMN05443529_1467 [Desulfosporosinus hippei DSM 8344]|uniref:Uncharacterized protein n=1 Tax=Desulfosporosinus hippei DSM 8344 TaxID=1121419 RepID=A0A1G8L7M4_9FIRM|nr:hypothetical protein SAMN05443529_1467 [Desulfosporosinus hippei DSM 8344]
MSTSQDDKEYTFRDYLTYPEDERWEIIDGVPFMQASPTPVLGGTSNRLSYIVVPRRFQVVRHDNI